MPRAILEEKISGASDCAKKISQTNPASYYNCSSAIHMIFFLVIQANESPRHGLQARTSTVQCKDISS